MNSDRRVPFLIILFVCIMTMLKWIQNGLHSSWLLMILLLIFVGMLGSVIFISLPRGFNQLKLTSKKLIGLYLAVIWLAILWLPLGLFGFTNFIKAAIPVSGAMFTWITVNRQVIVISLMILYLLALGLTLRIRKFLVLLLSGDEAGFIRTLKLAWRDGSFGDLVRSWLAILEMVVAVFAIITGITAFNHLISNQTIWFISKGLINFVVPIVELKTMLRLFSSSIHFDWKSGRLWVFGGVSLLLTTVIGAANVNNGRPPRPQTIIVHRGVIDHNGTGNTIAALKKNSRFHFPYVEMDIQETKDHHFICAHDDTVSIPHKRPQEINTLSLKTVKKYHHVELFGDYLKIANRLHQPLIIELKVTNQSDKQMGTRFADQYRAGLQRLPHRVHSIGYAYLRQIKRQLPHTQIGLVTMLNFGDMSKLNVNFYTLEHYTVSNYLIRSADIDQRQIYTWTDNSRLGMFRSAIMGVNGQVTDQAQKLAHLKINLDRDRLVLLLNYLLDYL